MQFEVKLPGRLAGWALRTAGTEAFTYYQREMDVLLEGASLPFNVSCPYFSLDKLVPVRITALALSPDAHLRIEVDDGVIGNRIREHLVRYSVENNGLAVLDRERKAILEKVDNTLKLYGLTHEQLQRRKTILTRPAMEVLMRLCDETEDHHKIDIYQLFTPHSVSKANRAFAAGWFLGLFEAERIPHEQTCCRIWELACPQIAEDLIRLIEDRRYGNRRSMLCLALAKTKYPRGAKVIASILDDEGMARSGLEALGKLKATQHVECVRRFLRHPDANVRREAKKTLKRFGCPVETPPPPVHLVKNRRSVTNDLEEWSANLDIEELKPTFDALSKCTETGFGSQEIAEVLGVVDDMKHDQTKAFCFPIAENGQKSEVWVVIFMDDIDSPDLEIYGSAELIQNLKITLPARE